MEFNKIELWYNELHNGNLEEAKKYFIKLYDDLSRPEYLIDTAFLENYISLCKWLAEVHLKNGEITQALDNYLFIYNNLSDTNFDTLATIWQIYKNIWDREKSKLFLKRSKEIDYGLFKQRFWHSIETISSRMENNKHIYLYIISKCSFSCCFCDRWEEKHKNDIKIETTLEEIKNIISEEVNDISSISVGWNEPLTNKNIVKIFEYLNSLDIKLQLYTSWSEKGKLKDLMIFKNIETVYLPMYSSIPSVHDHVVWREWAFNDLKEIENILKKNNINIYWNKLLIKANFWVDGYIGPWEDFNTLHPKNKKLYFENSISLTDIITRIDFKTPKYYNLLESNTIPICTVYNLINNKTEIIDHFKKIFPKIKELRISHNLIHEYVRPSKCGQCVMKNSCLWYYKLYFEKYWENEINPI